MLAPRGAYARLGSISASYIVSYVLFMSLLIAAAASVSTTERVTVSLLVSLSVSWMFVPLVHVLIGVVLVASARAPRIRGPHAVALLLMGHAPWSLFLLMAALMIAIGGFNGYRLTPLLAVPAVILTCRIVRAFCLEVLQTSARGAVLRTLAHQAVTWLLVTIYLEKAVGLVPRVSGWLS